MSPAVRTVLPLAAITCTAMLAMDLYLPAVPDMQGALGLSIPQGQATVAIFLAGLAAHRLLPRCTRPARGGRRDGAADGREPAALAALSRGTFDPARDVTMHLLPIDASGGVQLQGLAQDA